MTITNEKPMPSLRLAYSPKDFCDATGLSRPTLYRMMKAGEIAFVKARRRTLIPATEMEKLLEGAIDA